MSKKKNIVIFGTGKDEFVDDFLNELRLLDDNAVILPKDTTLEYKHQLQYKKMKNTSLENWKDWLLQRIEPVNKGKANDLWIKQALQGYHEEMVINETQNNIKKLLRDFAKYAIDFDNFDIETSPTKLVNDYIKSK